jgi:hypothetical protein
VDGPLPTSAVTRTVSVMHARQTGKSDDDETAIAEGLPTETRFGLPNR